MVAHIDNAVAMIQTQSSGLRALQTLKCLYQCDSSGSYVINDELNLQQATRLMNIMLFLGTQKKTRPKTDRKPVIETRHRIRDTVIEVMVSAGGGDLSKAYKNTKRTKAKHLEVSIDVLSAEINLRDTPLSTDLMIRVLDMFYSIGYAYGIDRAAHISEYIEAAQYFLSCAVLTNMEKTNSPSGKRVLPRFD